MPRKNVRKLYIENAYYHIYNRGVNKSDIFLEKNDYQVFLNILKSSLAPPPSAKELRKAKIAFTLKGQTFKGLPKLPKNFHNEIQLISYCLMPNHFHLLIKQKSRSSVSQFLQSISTRFVLYFNKKHKRTGSLFESTYKAVLIENDNQLLHLSRYIHQNPLKIWKKPLKSYPYSSYAEFLGLRNTLWINPQEILAFFKTRRKQKSIDFTSYQSFVETEDESTKEILFKLTLE